MEKSYGRAVTNKFDLFIDDDVDPLELLRIKEEEKLKKKDTKLKKDPKDDNKLKDTKTKQNKAKSNAQSAPPSDKTKSNEDKENRRDATGEITDSFARVWSCFDLAHVQSLSLL